MTSTDSEQRYDDVVADSVDIDIITKLDKILENQNVILSKLNMVSEIKEEIKGIKRILHNHSLALSTLDGYINDLLIVIPSKGVQEKISEGKTPQNPDLRMVIGRDKNRGLDEVLDKTKQVPKFGERLGPENIIDGKYLTDDLDFKRNNAANFIPSEDGISLRIINSLIDTRVHNQAKRRLLKELVEDNTGKLPLAEIYQNISSYLDKEMI